MGEKPKTKNMIFETLEKLGIKVLATDQYYKFISTSDYETIQVPDYAIVHGREMHYFHIPASYSVYSNVPGHTEPVHTASDGNPQKLVGTMLEIQLEHQEGASEIMKEQFDWVFSELQSN